MKKDMTLKGMKVPKGGLLNPGLRHISTNVSKISLRQRVLGKGGIK